MNERDEAQERIAALEAELTDAKRQLELTERSYNSDMRNALAKYDELDAENRALRDQWEELLVAISQSLEEAVEGQHFAVAQAVRGIERIAERLDTEHGLPLPEVELADDASDDEQHHGPVCWLCGASILFAGFDLCTNCERGMLDD